MNVVKIQYKDDRDWTTWVDSTVTNWDNYSTKLKEERVQPAWTKPEVTPDTWNGKDFDVQHIRWDAYYFQIFIKESELHDINKLLDCDDIKITYYTKNSTGTVINNTYTLDLTKSDLLKIDEPERADTTTGWTVNITFVINRTVINKALPVLNTNKIEFEGGDTLNKISEQSFANVKIFRLSDNNAIFIDSEGIEKRQYSGGQWTVLGNKLISATLANGEAAGLSSTRAAIFDSNGDLGTYDHDGTDWTLTGNKLNIATAGNFVSLAKVDTAEIATANDNTNFLEQFTFSAPNWSSSSTQNSLGSISNPHISEWDSVGAHNFLYIDSTNNQIKVYRYTTGWSSATLNITITGKAAISEISATNAVLVDQSNTARYVNIIGTTLTLLATISVDTVASPYIAQIENGKVSITEDSFIKSYEYAEPTYYTDYDVLDYSRQTESFFIDWPDGTRKLARTIDKIGFESVFYLESDNYDDFISKLKASEATSINDVEVDEVEFEPSIIAEGLWKIVVSGITETIQDDKDLSPNNTYNISMSGGGLVFYSDYPILQNIRDVQKVDVEWDDGNTVTLQTVTKPTNIFTFFTSDPGTIIERVNLYNDVTLMGSVITEIETSQEEVLLNLFKVIINGVHDVANDLLYVFPTSGNHLEIIDENPTTYDFYTDYDVMLVSEDPIINATENQTGINTPTKGITKEVKQAKFFLSEANAFSLKSKFELYKPGWSLKLNTVAVKEARPVSPNRIGVDLYEVDVICLMDTTDN